MSTIIALFMYVAVFAVICVVGRMFSFRHEK
jgi:hypothetical protein